jgi:hypothetical protein
LLGLCRPCRRRDGRLQLGKDRDEGFEPRPKVHLASYTLAQRALYEAGESGWLRRIKTAPLTENASKVESSTGSDPSVPRAIVAPIAAGPKVLASTRSPLISFPRKNYGDAVAVEMEGYGFLRGVHMNPSVEGIVVRGVSDCIGDKAPSRERQDEVQGKVAELNRQFTSLRNQQDRLLNLRHLEEIDEQTFAGKNTELRDRIADLNLQERPIVEGQNAARSPRRCLNYRKSSRRNGLTQITVPSVNFCKSSV